MSTVFMPLQYTITRYTRFDFSCLLYWRT